MSKIRSSDTGPERIMADLVSELNVKAERWANLPGKPDFVFERQGLVVFIDGCFWHRCPDHGTRPKTNKKFWDKKFSNNVRRDKKVNQILESCGWRVVRFWEHRLVEDPDAVLWELSEALGRV